MADDIVSMKLDVVFKKMFVDNRDMLQAFVASMLEIPVDSISGLVVKNPEIPPDFAGGKFSRLDLNMTVGDVLVNVEIQVKRDPDFRDRALYYWARLYTSELKSGEVYGSLHRAISINIVDFNMFPGEGYCNEVLPRVTETGEIFSDKMTLYFFELKKLSKKLAAGNSRELWLQFINAESKEELDMISQANDPIMQKAVRVVYDMSEDTRVREMVRMREKALHDEASALKNAYGRGREEERAKMISSMRANGMSEKEIEKIVNSIP